MHRSEAEDRDCCADCGAEIAVGRDRTFEAGPDLVLCFHCAMSRGGAYDDVRDHWTRFPNLGGLSQRLDPEARGRLWK